MESLLTSWLLQGKRRRKGDLMKVKVSLKKAEKLVGKDIEFVPWYQPFRKDTTMTGKLIRIRGAMAGKKGRPAKKAEKVMVVKPTGKTRKWLRDLGVMKPNQKTVSFLLTGHKLRSQKKLNNPCPKRRKKK